VFCRGLLFQEFPRDPIIDNVLGVVYYAAGDRTTAKEMFTSSARIGLHLPSENLATLAFEEGHPREALELLMRAARLQKRQTFGTPADAEHFTTITQAEYLNSAAVFHHALGEEEQALAAATGAVRLDPSVPTAYYNLGVLKLLRATKPGAGGSATTADAASVRGAMTDFSRAVDLDPGFLPAWGLLGVSQSMLGDCRGAIRALRLALYPPRGVRPEFPLETGRGIEHAASIGRRKQIDDLPEGLSPRHHLERCQTEGGT
jgi:tetratricopeptide (TPR) repeat protein